MKNRILHKGVLDKEQCHKLCEIFNKHKSKGWYGRYEVDEGKIKDDTDKAYYHNTIVDMIDVLSNHWETNDGPPICKLEYSYIIGYNFECKPHLDRPNRIYSSSILLNDDFEKGNFRFYNPDERMNMEIGDAVIFKSNQWHGVEPTDGRDRIAIQLRFEWNDIVI